MAELTIAVDDALARDLRQATPGGEELRQLLVDHGLQLVALHPGTTDPELARWFYASSSDESELERAVERLRRYPRIVAAYIKPPDAMP